MNIAAYVAYRDRRRRDDDGLAAADAGLDEVSSKRDAPRRPRLDLGAVLAVMGLARDAPPVRLYRASSAVFFLRASEMARELVALSMGKPSLTAVSISPAKTRSFLATRLVTLPTAPARAVRPER